MSRPPSANRRRMSDSPSTVWISRFSRSTISLGVAAGTITPCQVTRSKSGTVSASTASPPKGPMPRFGFVEAIARTRPDFTCPCATLTTSKSRLTSPPISAFNAGALPLYCTMIISAPAWIRSISQPTCGSAPEEAQLTLPGFARASAMTSATVLAGNAGWVNSTIDALSRWMTGASSLNGSMLAFRKNGLVMIAGTTNTTVVPSGAARAAASWPTLPPAPPRFSTIAGCPTRSASFADTRRVTTSAGPPGGNGTIQRIGFDGHAVCACTSVPANAIAAAKTAARCPAFMHLSPRRRRRRGWRRNVAGTGMGRGQATRYRNAVTLCIHALDVGVVVAPLEAVRGSFSRACPGRRAEEKPAARSRCRAASPAERCTRRGTYDGAHRGALRGAVGGYIRRRATSDLHVGELAALDVVVAELVEALARARQHHDAGTLGHAHARAQQERSHEERREPQEFHIEATCVSRRARAAASRAASLR